ncbi:sister chromatid cohesion protein SCC4 isoform X2 [Rhododendron vialii]|uniref:sister chromatid cohesion protein SCC4 isoform X2 n=1 Tax=Rhododendron vialii TaxID=182163 RepID=UPI00265FC32F|nr:sister chromatid cohesion protein SCC4 isoform X2 [Rhododendron vialii]
MGYPSPQLMIFGPLNGLDLRTQNQNNAQLFDHGGLKKKKKKKKTLPPLGVPRRGVWRPRKERSESEREIMEEVAEGLWGLADHHEKKGAIGKAVKCLEAICQSQVSFLPIVEVKTRLRIATLLLKHSHNVNHAKSHLERSQLLLKSIPSCFELKCRAHSLLSQCYHLVGAIPSQKQILNKGLALAASSGEGFSAKLWYCNFSSQLANALIIEGDYQGSISALEGGLDCASAIFYPELQMFFATSILHVHLMQWDDVNLVEGAINKCNEVWESIQPDKRQQCIGLLFYNELLHIFYLLRICNYKDAAQHVETLDAAMKADMQQMQHVQELTKELNALNLSLSRSDLQYKERSALSKKQAQLEEQLNNITGHSSAGKESLEPAYFGNVKRAWGDKLELAPPPIDGEWLPKSAVYALVELMVVIFGRPKGLFKECGKRIQSGLQTIQDELVKLGISDGVREVDLQHSAIWMAGVYLMLLMHFLENKVAVELTQSEFVEAQEALVQMRNWFIRFPTILQACESVIEMLRGQYAHSVGSYIEAAFHFVEAGKLTQSKSMQAMCQIYAAVSYICLGGPESSAQALDLIGPVYQMMDSFVGVREKTTVLFAYGFLLMRQQNLQEARVRLATGLQITHSHLGNLQLVSQYLTILGNLALALHDTGQAREILRSALTLSKKLYDIPTQIWVLTNLTALYQQLGEKGSEMENDEYLSKKRADLQNRLHDACSSIHHIEIIDKSRIQVHQLHELDVKRAMASASMRVNLDIPESVGISASAPAPSSRLMDLDIGRRGKRKI